MTDRETFVKLLNVAYEYRIRMAWIMP